MNKLIIILVAFGYLIIASEITGIFFLIEHKMTTNQFWASFVVLMLIDLLLICLSADTFDKLKLFKQDLGDVEFGGDISADIY